jgi:thiol-disulfide isomerase/thioredoxin
MTTWLTSILVSLGLIAGASITLAEREQTAANVAAAACYAALSDGQPAPQPQPQPKLALRALVFGSPLCPPCKALEADIRATLPGKGWRIGAAETDHVEFVDATSARDRATKYSVSVTPTTVIVDERGEQRAKLVGGGSAAFWAGWCAEKGLKP